MKNKIIRKRIRLGQNFFKNATLVELIVKMSTINKTDIVYEIGSGEGIMTKVLAKYAKKVVGFEMDINLLASLRTNCRNNENIYIIPGDFLRKEINEPKYKIFSNIPFNITAQVVKRILFGNNTPQEAYLVLQKEAANKFSGIPNESELSVLAKPWFEFEIIYEFNQHDFDPVPNVDVVLLHIKKKNEPLISKDNTKIYSDFVRFGFETWKKDLKTTYKNIFTYEQWKRLSKDLDFPFRPTPTDLSITQWIKLFEYFMIGVIDTKKTLVNKKK